MITDSNIHQILTYCTATVWIANGLFCKVLNLAPRHKQIVARILGNDYARTLTIAIGISETIMAIWIVSGFATIVNTIVQIAVVAIMNVIEFFLAPHLLLWGKFNALFAFLFIIVVYCNEFYFNIK